jgi:hypothetical protein
MIKGAAHGREMLSAAAELEIQKTLDEHCHGYTRAIEVQRSDGYTAVETIGTSTQARSHTDSHSTLYT